jgi:hypothetical protein
MNKKLKDSSTWRIVRPPLHPRFDMPTRKELFDVCEGDEVKLIFEDDDGMGERMWVTVTQCGNSDHWEGTLDNDPIGSYARPRLKYGSKLKFHPYDVIDIDLVRLKKDDALELKPEQVPTDNVKNEIRRVWYKDPQHLVPITIGLIGAATTIIAALL